jgi:hypothetical protein
MAKEEQATLKKKLFTPNEHETTVVTLLQDV